jgi:predicted permease
MRALKIARLRIRSLFRGARVEQELEAELRDHLARETERHRAAGVPPAEARAAARRAFGNVAAIQERCRDTRGVGWFEDLVSDAGYAIRLWRRSPGYAAVAVLSLALGIGANTAIFSLINSVYLRPLPVEDADRLVLVTGGEGVWESLRDRPGPFAHVGHFAATQFNVSPSSQTEWVDGIFVGGGFFEAMGVRAFAGRLLSERDNRPGGGPDGRVAVISYSLWQRRFGGVGDIVGQSISIQHVPFTIVGVTPETFFGPTVGRTFDVIVPRAAASELWSAMQVGDEVVELSFGWNVLARLRTDHTLQQARAALDAVRLDVEGAPRRDAAAPPPGRRPRQDSWQLVPAHARSPIRGQYQRPLVTLMIVVALVLLIACANVANLLQVRAALRRREFSVRRALGAPRGRLVRQCLAESLVLAFASAAGGLVIAVWARRLLVQQLAAEDALVIGNIAYSSARLFLDASFDWRVLTFTTAAAVATALAFGAVPAFQSSAARPIDVLKEGGTSTDATGSTTRSRLGWVRAGATGYVLVAQVAISLVLLVAAVLFVGTFTRLSNLPLGFTPDEMVVVDLDLKRTADSREPQLAAAQQVLDSVRRLPGVTAAALSVGGPPLGGSVADRAEVRGADPPADPRIGVTLVSPGWFDAHGTQLIAGRDFSERDRTGMPRVAVVNETFVRRFIPGSVPLGRMMTSGVDAVYAPGSSIEIVGVVGDIVAFPPRDGPAAAAYLPLAQADGGYTDVLGIVLEEKGLTLSVRAVARERIAQAIADAAVRVDPALGLTMRYPDQQVRALTTRERVLAMLAGFFGSLAVLLSSLGLYGVAAYAVARQRREIALRMALGAAARSVVRLVLGRILALVAVGLAVGIVGSLWAGKFVAALLYGVSARDLPTAGVAAAILLGIGALVGWLPARRAARVDPAILLRYE